MKPYAQYKTDGSLWKAGSTILGLCAAYNHATNPSIAMTSHEHDRSFCYARAIKNRMSRLGFKYGKHYAEQSNGSLWPLPVNTFKH